MSSNNRALVLHPNLDLKVENVPDPEPRPQDVVIAINSTGICGTDLHMWHHGGAGLVKVTKKMILGHESSGTIVKVGSEVTHLKVGDRVTVEPAIPCLNCYFCILGKYNHCPNLDGRGYPNDGMCSTLYAHPAQFCFKLPDNVSFEEGALVEPLAVAVHVVRRAGITAGQRVLIIGAGPIGLLSLLCVKAYGGSEVAISDITESRLELAKKIGANHIILTSKSTVLKEEALKVFGEQPDVVIDCFGSGQTAKEAVESARSGGVVAIVGLGGTTAAMSLPDIVMREVDVRGCSRYVNCYPTALSLLGSRSVDVRPLITHRFALDDALKAFQTALDGKSGAVKVLIKTEG